MKVFWLAVPCKIFVNISSKSVSYLAKTNILSLLWAAEKIKGTPHVNPFESRLSDRKLCWRQRKARTDHSPCTSNDMFTEVQDKSEERHKKQNRKSLPAVWDHSSQQHTHTLTHPLTLPHTHTHTDIPWPHSGHNWRRVRVAVGAACTFNAYEILSSTFSCIDIHSTIQGLPPLQPISASSCTAEPSAPPNYQTHKIMPARTDAVRVDD